MVTPIQKALIRKMDDSDPSVRSTAVNAIVEAFKQDWEGAPPELWEVIDRGLRDQSTEVRMKTGMCLTMADPPNRRRGQRDADGFNLPESIVVGLMANGKDSDSSVRQWNAWALGNWNVREATELLLELMDDPDADVREVAVRVVGEFAAEE